ncbi:hypothetical protein MMC08_001783 [Hypocenomyce scalaris]|nr:hypothetical protein [Hypocenomyce scalaris]
MAPTTLIIGAGIFGTSTAYHLSLTSPPSTIILLDRAPYPPPPASSLHKDAPGASSDINKIVRADYSTRFYMDLAVKAIEAWSSWEILKPYYHRTGWVMLDEKESDLSEKIRRNFRAREREGLGRDESRDMSFEAVRQAWGGLLEKMDSEGFGNAYWNPGAGWADADKAVAAMMREAVGRGVRYVRGEATALILRPEGGGVGGVRLGNGRVVKADRVLLATGAWTSALLSKTEDELGIGEADRVEQQAKAAGVCVAHYKLNDEEKKRFDQLPVVVYGENGEVLPPPRSALLKFTNASTFTNTHTTPSNHHISIPPSSQTHVPNRLKRETISIIQRITPSLLAPNKQQPDYWRLCWDSITPTQDQLITRHPDEKLGNLYLAVGGSFHSWKFLPVMGEFVVNVLEGRGNGREMNEHWAWKKEGWGSSGGGRGAHEKVVPTRELRDLEERGRL